MTFKEVKRIYTGSDVQCYSLRNLMISAVRTDGLQKESRQQVEWLVALKITGPQMQEMQA